MRVEFGNIKTQKNKGEMARTKQTAMKNRSTTGSKQRRLLKQRQQSQHMKKTSDGLKKQRRYKPGTVALREIRKMQKSTHLLMAKRPFQRLVRQVIRKVAPAGIDMRIERKALQALQEASEAYLVEVLQATNKAALHRRRVTIAPLDVRFAMDMRGDNMIAVVEAITRDVGLDAAACKKST